MTSLARARALLLLFVVLAVLAADRQTLVNEQYGFRINFPTGWTLDRVEHPNPFPDLQEFKSGRAHLGGSIGTLGSGEVPANWNAVYLNQGQAAAPGEAPARPTILVYAHAAPAKSFEEFSTYFKEFMGMLRMEVVSARKVTTASGLEGYDYIYRMGPIPTRVCVFFTNGRRYGLTYFDMDEKAFEAYQKDFNELVNAFEVVPAPAR